MPYTATPQHPPAPPPTPLLTPIEIRILEFPPRKFWPVLNDLEFLQKQEN